MTTAVKPRPQESLPIGLGYVIRHTHKAFSKRLAAELARHGISFKHYFYLRALLEEDHISQIELSERVGMQRATLTSVVATLESRGYIRRLDDPDDKRKSVIALTAKGRRLREPLVDTIEAIQRIASAGIARADLEHFRTICDRMSRNLDQHEAE